MALIQYLLWLKRNYPDAYREFDMMPVGGKFYDATYNFVGKELERITGEKILLCGDGYSFHYNGKSFQKPDALIRYAKKLKRKNPMHKEYADAMMSFGKSQANLKKRLTERKIELAGKEIDNDLLNELWSVGAPVFVNGKKYALHKMSYGDYFLEPFGYQGRETDPFHPNTLWLEKVDKYYYKIAE